MSGQLLKNTSLKKLKRYPENNNYKTDLLTRLSILQYPEATSEQRHDLLASLETA